jgi:hypothetical protein
MFSAFAENRGDDIGIRKLRKTLGQAPFMALSNIITGDPLYALYQTKTAPAKNPQARKDFVAPAATPPLESSSFLEAPGTKLVSETREERENGFRRTRTFEREDGRVFTRVEDFALTAGGARRNVIQQNPSGSITQYEEVLDRQDNGKFRRTQRFQDETGRTETQITADYNVTDPFILSGGQSAYFENLPLFSPSRGTRLDLEA